MAALFTPRSNTIFQVSLALFALCALGVPSALLVAQRTPYVTGQQQPVDQPIQFDHRHHVRDDGIDCRYCHDLVEISSSAGVPPTERCLNCHNQIWNRSEKLAPVWASYASGLPIRWQRVHQLPDFVYFDHSAHLNAGVGCVTCHGRVDRMARVHQRQPLTMQWCVQCHEDPRGRLRPRALLTAMIEDPLPPELAAGARSDVRPGTDCTICHR